MNVGTAFRKLLQSRRLEAAALRTIDAFEAQQVANILHIIAKTRYSPRDQSLVPQLDGRAEALAGTFKAQDVANTLWAYATMGREPGAGMMRALEGRAEALAGSFIAQGVANTLWAYATMGREPGTGLLRALEGRAEAVAGTFKAQEVANTLWAYATMGREPGAGLMRLLEGRAEALAGTFNAQGVAITVWAACVFCILFDRGQGWRWVHTLVQRLASLGEAASFNTVQLRQVHQFFVGCSVEPGLRMEAVNDMWALKETCREAFECAKSAP